MEVSTVSPPPALPTEAEDPCEINVSNVAIHSVTLLISLSGLLGNGAVVCLLSLELPDSRIFDMTVVDFLFLLFTAPSALLFLLEDVSCSTIMPVAYLSFIFQLSMVSCYWVLWRLRGVSMVKGVYKLCWLCCHCRLPERLRWAMFAIQSWAFFALITVIPMMTSLCPSHEQGHCRVALISMFTVILLLFAAPTLISSTIDFIKAKCGSQQQQLKRLDIVIFLIVLFTLLIIICDFLQQFGYIIVSSQVFFLLTCINSTIKPFIYFLLGRCWRNCSVESLRDALQRVFEEKKGNTTSKRVATTDTVV